MSYDDPDNVYDNPRVAHGLTLDAFVSAFTHTQVGHWNPLTTLSHMLVSQFCGVNPGGHHLGNVLIHGAAAVLLFLVLWRMTSFLWRSAFVAAVFAIHPLRVESVAWVTERKDVLSGVFFMLTLAAYVRYVRAPQSPARYVSVAVLFVLGLMSKSMLVTLPFVLLLLDYWPLGRFDRASSGQSFFPTLRALLREKIPLLALSALFAVIQIIANWEGIVDSGKMPLAMRMGNAIASYADYIGQMFYPARLAVFYPHPEGTLPAWKLALAFAVLAAISSAAFGLRKRHPYLITGWLWYLGMLVPVIGLVQSGDLARADRYTYLPHIGLYLAFTWTVADLFTGLSYRRLLFAPAAVAAIAALMTAAWRQTAYWHDSETLWQHALTATKDNYMAQESLGMLHMTDRPSEAMNRFRAALEINPGFARPANNLGFLLLQSGRVEEAIGNFRKAVELRPDYTQARFNLGNALLATGHIDEAIDHYQRVVESSPDFARAECNLGLAYQRTGRIANAITHYQRAVELDPSFAGSQGALGRALLQEGRAREAVPHIERALEITPDIPVLQNDLAWLRATSAIPELRNGVQAVELAEKASKAADGKNILFRRTLAAAYAEAGRFPEAIQTVQRALQLPESEGDKAQRDALRAELELYRSGSPFHESR